MGIDKQMYLSTVVSTQEEVRLDEQEIENLTKRTTRQRRRKKRLRQSNINDKGQLLLLEK